MLPVATPPAPEEGDPWTRLYAELRAIAGRMMARERPGHTLQTTALVHESWLRLAGGTTALPANRAEFLRLAGRVIRNVLVDHARSRGRAKRGDGRVRPRIDLDAIEVRRLEPSDILDLDEALEELAKLDERQARVVELRCFGGMTLEEVAEALDVSVRTVGNEWRVARAWLASRLESPD